MTVNSFDLDALSKLCDFLQVNPGDLLVVVEQVNLFASTHDANEAA